MARQSKHAPGAVKLMAAGTANHDGRICSSGKVCFATEGDARSAAVASRALSRVDLAIYKCDECALYHHTKSTGGRSNPLPPMRAPRVVTPDRLTRVVGLLRDADALAIDALMAYPNTDVKAVLAACDMARREAVPMKTELENEGIHHPRRDSLARELMDALERVETKRRALARLTHQ